MTTVASTGHVTSGTKPSVIDCPSYYIFFLLIFLDMSYRNHIMNDPFECLAECLHCDTFPSFIADIMRDPFNNQVGVTY